MKKLEPGLLELNNWEYHFGILKDALGGSGLSKLYRKSVDHYIAYVNEEEKPPTPALVFGQAYHIYTLERKKFAKLVAIMPEINRRTTAGKAEYEDFMRINKGKVVITQADADLILEMARGMAKYQTATSIFLNPGVFEQTVIWREPLYKYWAKCRTDYHIPNLQLIIDLKTTMDASEDGFSRSISNYDYDLSAAWYTGGLYETTGHTYQYLWVVQEKEPPYAVAIYEADQEILDNGRKKIRYALEKYRDFDNGELFAGYPDSVQKIRLKSWGLV